MYVRHRARTLLLDPRPVVCVKESDRNRRKRRKRRRRRKRKWRRRRKVEVRGE